jgi:hypothetical protein
LQNCPITKRARLTDLHREAIFIIINQIQKEIER